MFFPITLGWFIRFRRHIGEKDIGFLNRLCFRYLLAFHLFNSTVSIDFRAEFNPGLLAACSLCLFFVMIFFWIIFSLTVPDREKRCILIVSSFRSNNIIYALPMAVNLFGDAGTKVAAMLMPLTIILFNFFCVAVMVYHAPHETAAGETGTLKGAGGEGPGAAFKRTVLDILKNPLLIGSVLGIVFSLLNVPLPRFVRGGISMIAASATPLSLILLGAQIDFKALAGNLGPAFGACALRLILVPAILVPLLVMAGFRGAELGALMVVFSAPCAVNNLIMARNYKINPAFAAQTVYLSTVFSLFTMSGLISLLRRAGLF
jgi:predicted permease